jgi:hypothetical protein
MTILLNNVYVAREHKHHKHRSSAFDIHPLKEITYPIKVKKELFQLTQLNIVEIK